MDCVRLIQLDKDDSEFEIKVETKIGRGPVFDISDKKVSRNHAILTPVLDEDRLELKSTHINPCFVQRNGEEKKLVLEKDSSMKLANGDLFSLLSNKHCFKVVLACKSKPEEKSNGKIQIVPVPQGNQRLEESEDKDSDSVSGPVKKENDQEESLSQQAINFPSWHAASLGRPPPADQKRPLAAPSSSDEDDKDSKGMRRTCAFGSKCYRKNPSHFVDFSHPGDSDHDSNPSAKDDSGKKVCMYGTKCYRKNPEHKKEFSHPPKEAASSSRADTSRRSPSSDDSKDEDEEREGRKPTRLAAKRKRKVRKTYSEDRESDDIPSEEDISDEDDVYVAKSESESLSEDSDWAPKTKKKKAPPPPKPEKKQKKKRKRYEDSESDLSDSELVFDDTEESEYEDNSNEDSD